MLEMAAAASPFFRSFMRIAAWRFLALASRFSAARNAAVKMCLSAQEKGRQHQQHTLRDALVVANTEHSNRGDHRGPKLTHRLPVGSGRVLCAAGAQFRRRPGTSVA